MKEVWVYAESEGGRLHPVVSELLGEGRRLAERIGGSLGAVLASSHASLAEELALWADRVYVIQDQSPYTDEWQGQALARLIEAYQPGIVLFGGTRRGKSLAPRVAARLRTGLIADCTSLRLDDGGLLLAELPTFGGRLLTTIACPGHRPQMATLAPGAFAPGPKGSGGEIINCPWAAPEVRAVEVVAQEPLPEEDRPLMGAEIVSAGKDRLRANFFLERWRAFWGGRWRLPPGDAGWGLEGPSARRALSGPAFTRLHLRSHRMCGMQGPDRGREQRSQSPHSI